MGQRQQLFVIARVGSHHRCLAVVHHQSLFARLSLETCLQLIKIFSDKANRRALELELRLAADFYKDQEPPSKPLPINSLYESHPWTPVRFPFIATCLVLGASTCRDRDHLEVFMTHFEPEDLGFDQGDNNDGIIVLDITDLDNVRYCFSAWFRIGERWSTSLDDPNFGQARVAADPTTPPGLYSPWSGWEYAQHYIGRDSSPTVVQALRDLSDQLAQHPLVEVSALADVWPWGKWFTGHSPVMPRPMTGLTGGASLRDQALAKLLQSLLISEQSDTSLLNAPLRIPNFRADLREHLYGLKDRLLKSPIAPELLRAAFAGESHVDLAAFPGLAPETIISMAQGSDFEGACTLSLCPDWSNTEPIALARAICSFPHLKDVYVMELPGRASEGPMGELYKALAADSRCPTGKLFLAGAASRSIKYRMWLPTAEPFTPPPSYPILQLLVIHRRWPYWDIEPEGPRVYYFHLADAFLTPTKLANGLVRVLARHLVVENETIWSQSVSHHFSWAAPTFDDPSALEISTLPAETFAVAKRQYSTSIFKGCFTKMRDLLPGTWTVLVDVDFTRHLSPRLLANPLLGNTSPQSFFQCAFVRPRNGITIPADPKNPTASEFGPQDLEVLDFEGFLRATAPNANLEGLNRQLAWLEERGLSLLDDDDVVARTRGNRLSRTPMEPARACELLKQAINRLPVVHKWYRESDWQLPADEKWYPELDLSPTMG
ncbi:hypothetical protein VTI74DRAFT_2620 [Chaetomium olivicolor]